MDTKQRIKLYTREIRTQLVKDQKPVANTASNKLDHTLRIQVRWAAVSIKKSTLSKNNISRFNEHVETKSVNKIQSVRSQASKVPSRISQARSAVKSKVSTQSKK